MGYFRIELSKVQIETLCGLLNVQAQLEEEFSSMREICRVAHIDFNNNFFPQKEWLIQNKILKEKDGLFRIDFDNIACLLYRKSNLSVLYELAMQYLPEELLDEPE